jgi:hypothetical protein
MHTAQHLPVDFKRLSHDIIIVMKTEEAVAPAQIGAAKPRWETRAHSARFRVK